MPVFTLRNKEAAAAAWKFIKDNAAEQARIGQPLVVSVDAYQEKRSTQANARLWAILTDIAKQAVIDGARFSKEAWFEHFKNEYAPKQEGPSGQHYADDQAAVRGLYDACGSRRGADARRRVP
jgi:hypothetical protein